MDFLTGMTRKIHRQYPESVVSERVALWRSSAELNSDTQISEIALLAMESYLFLISYTSLSPESCLLGLSGLIPKSLGRRRHKHFFIAPAASSLDGKHATHKRVPNWLSTLPQAPISSHVSQAHVVWVPVSHDPRAPVALDSISFVLDPSRLRRPQSDFP